MIVLLPGRFGGPRDYEKAQFARWAAERRIAAELVAVDAHIGYYRDRSVVERIHRDIVLPARAEGVREVWIVGVSMGGLGSLLYAREHGEELGGVVALAPYLGEEELLSEIRSQGGPRSWQSEVDAGEPRIEGLWRWLQQEAAADSLPPIYLGVGSGDSLAPANRLLAELLPPERVLETAGGHDWRAWSELWRQFLDLGVACRGATPPA